ncbi:corrinoid protein [Desulfosporosinus sp. PR]|uniref:corrinoid protein n=1 Tax=Candidatus Desulfosporosinus nitrosoreducens TaxID=3401928 RepID=UPI0027FE9472|nr:corrinoid protein [Desulfosporosinus sp. PR]MDQ7095305.1 corrinoid protein [Desulfosporosinus sp. PR]
MPILNQIKEALMSGDANEVRKRTTKALEEGLDPVVIINDGFITAMNIIGVKFRNNEVYVPEVLIAARAMHTGMDTVKPYLTGAALQEKGTILIGTVKGDLHDIGKNLVSIMLQSGGFRVIDLGIDISVEKFVEAVEEYKPDVVAISALLTSTITYMKNIIEGLADYRGQLKIIVGGAPVTQDFADQIGADAYAPDAASAVEKVRKLLEVA